MQRNYQLLANIGKQIISDQYGSCNPYEYFQYDVRQQELYSVKEEYQKYCRLIREFSAVRTKPQELKLGKTHKKHATVQHAHNKHDDKLSKVIWNNPPNTNHSPEQ